jgi:hypothetical protein
MLVLAGAGGVIGEEMVGMGEIPYIAEVIGGK